MPEFSEYISVPDGWFYVFEDGVFSVLEPKIKSDLDVFLQKHQSMQQEENYNFLPAEYLEDFPFIDYEPYNNETFSRKQDITLLDELAKPYFFNDKSVLEIGGWNSWLTRRLQDHQMQVITADIFNDERNGLRSKNAYANNGWLSLHTDITSTTIYKKKFDLIIFNHCLQFMPEPELMIRLYKQLLNPGGMLIILGLDFFANTRKQHEKVDAYRCACYDKYSFNIHFYTCKGFLDTTDYKMLKSNGFMFKSYRFSLPGGLKKVLFGQKSGIMYYQHPSNVSE